MSKKVISTIMYDITMNCNLRCSHCYNAEQLSPGHYVEANISEIIDGLSKIKFQHIVIQGGEPLMVKNLEELIEWFSNKGVNVFITTNATLLTPDRTVRLIKAGIKGIFFSLESTSEKINDDIRGKGTYRIFYNNVKNFMSIYTELFKKKYIPPLRAALSCTASSINFSTDQSIRDMFCFANELGISDITFNFLINQGACKQLDYNKHMTNFELANSIVRISKEFPEICVKLPMKQIEHDYLKKHHGEDINICGAKGRCPAGERIAYVDPDLKIYPCIWLSHMNKRKSLAFENTVSLHNYVPTTLFESFIEAKNKCLSIFKECSACEYNGECIPICPCLEGTEEKAECMGKPCPTREEIGGYKK